MPDTNILKLEDNIFTFSGDDGPDDMCIKCLCHARTGCYFLRNCASYSISYDYWQTAGSPSIDSSTGRTAYEKCKKNEDCIRATIRGYIRTHDLQVPNNLLFKWLLKLIQPLNKSQICYPEDNLCINCLCCPGDNIARLYPKVVKYVTGASLQLNI